MDFENIYMYDSIFILQNITDVTERREKVNWFKPTELFQANYKREMNAIQSLPIST